jgi:predicted Zn-dependent protease
LEILLGATRAKGAIRDIAGIANGLWTLRYSRGEEDAADAKGLQNMVSAKFELEGMLDLFNTLQKASEGKDGGGPDFMRSHPLTKDRIRKTEERIMKLRDSG